MMTIDEINALFRSAPGGFAKGHGTVEQARAALAELGEVFRLIDTEDADNGRASNE